MLISFLGGFVDYLELQSIDDSYFSTCFLNLILKEPCIPCRFNSDFYLRPGRFVSAYSRKKLRIPVWCCRILPDLIRRFRFFFGTHMNSKLCLVQINANKKCHDDLRLILSRKV